MLKDFKILLLFMVFVLIVVYFFGGVKDMLIVVVLCVFEILLLFDNVVVNVLVLKNWLEKWCNCFMVFGLLVVVFGMWFVFLLLIVVVIGYIGLWDVLMFVIELLDKYVVVLMFVYYEVLVFGGVFLLMVFFKFMFDIEKDEYWIGFFEGLMCYFGCIIVLEVVLMLVIVIVVLFYVLVIEQVSFLFVGVFGVIGFVIVYGVGDLVGGEDMGMCVVCEGVVGFMYLEVFDLLFSFDGVIGVFVLLNNIFLIVFGFGVGVVYIWEMMFVLLKKGMFVQYCFFEYGVFWVIGVFVMIMFLGVKFEVLEVVMGLIGVVMIVVVVWLLIVVQCKEDCVVVVGK